MHVSFFVVSHDRSHHPFGAFGRLCNSSRADPWPEFPILLAHVVVGFCLDFRMFGILRFGCIFGHVVPHARSYRACDAF